ncbi:hypothetical protein TeGR_g1137 [Tetraparma gracilis]|uniref:Uncharacterized protein n=1 Tax=Tetraparma gracilis TaxID=2962635 RepID=A0ABQ6MA71_9STRA|nr:hypothetical protein TeGR_g1137 [Tetraparma gracilis]
MSMGQLNSDKRAEAHAHNMKHNRLSLSRSAANLADALERLNPQTNLPISDYMSDPAGALVLWEEQGGAVQEKYGSVLDFLGVDNISDATVGITGITEAEKQAFTHVAPGVHMSESLTRIREYPRMTAHDHPASGSVRVAFELLSHKDAAFVAHGEGAMIIKNKETFAEDTMDNNAYQKAGGVGGARSVFLSYTDDEGITHGNALPPWNTCLYVMLVVEKSVLEEALLQAAKEKKRKASEM